MPMLLDDCPTHDPMARPLPPSIHDRIPSALACPACGCDDPDLLIHDGGGGYWVTCACCRTEYETISRERRSP